ncbi:hypothetical protein ACJJVG_18980 [Pseudocitrobacter faecalis]|uniref:hypothetical protein n=1 Tax=Pseudocitrobacter faecalis TaxID=1398493 RepID=UPI003899C2F8
MAFLRWCEEKSAGCGFALSGLQKNNPTEWHGSAAGQLRATGQYSTHNASLALSERYLP